MTTIVVISDTHGRHRDVDVPGGDILVHAGDFTGSGRMSDVDEVDDWLGDLPHATTIVVAGNCDRCCERDPDEVRERLTNATYLQDESLEVEGLHIYGSPWQPVFLNMSFNLPRGEALAEKWAQIPEETDILVTHGPPFGIRDRTSRGEEVGDRALLERVTELQPAYHFFGHVHESSGVEERGGTTFVNAACDRKGKTPFVVEV